MDKHMAREMTPPNDYSIEDAIQKQCHHHYERLVLELCSECGAAMPCQDYMPGPTGTSSKTIRADWQVRA